MEKMAVGIWAYGKCAERYVSDGYREPLPFNERIARAAAIGGVSGVELSHPHDVSAETWGAVKALLGKNGLRIASVIAETVCDASWRNGSLGSPDGAARERAVAEIRGAMDVAALSGAGLVNLWLGQDGFDYVFEADYAAAWENLVRGLRECAAYRPDVRLALEYKMSEPRMKSYVNNAGTALALCLMTERPNVGVTLDIGHSFNAGENPAASVALLASQRRLFHVHINDNYGVADDDMPAGSVHWPQWFEFVHWLRKVGYDGWVSVDIYPYRDDPQEACRASVEFFELAGRVADRMTVGDAPSKSATLRRLFDILK